jgi:hypothetical protein
MKKLRAYLSLRVLAIIRCRLRYTELQILHVVLYGCETWLLILREEHRLTVLRKIFGPKKIEVTGEWRNYIMRSFMIYTPNPIVLG